MSIKLIVFLIGFLSIADCSSIHTEQSSKDHQATTSSITFPKLINSNGKCTQNNSADEESTLWMNFSIQEYDLIDYLKNLSAKYKNVMSSPGDELVALQEQDSTLEAKHHSEVHSQEIPKKSQQRSTTTKLSTQTRPTIKSNDKFSEYEPFATSLASDLYLGDQEIAESNWQYGIFDRFTRARSTTTTPAPDPRFTLDPLAKIDMRLYNSDECGLRTYNQRDPVELTGHVVDQLLGIGDRPFLGQQFPASPLASGTEHQSSSAVISAPLDNVMVGAPSDPPENQETAIKELHHRRQRPSALLNNGPNSIADLIRWQKLESIYGNKQLAAESQSTSSETSKIANWPNKDEKENYDNYKSHLGSILQKVPMVSQQPSGSSSSPSDEEFNLLARRNWLQQQIGNTLQMFASFNGTNELFPNIFTNQTTNSSISNLSFTSIANRENMMKKFGNLRVAREKNNDPPPGGALSQTKNTIQPQVLLKPVVSIAAAVEKILADSTKELKARQDELKLEPRVIGGNDARLGDSPWSVSLQALVSRPGTGQVEYRHYCGGTIISEHYILTAAHCLDFMVGRESRLFVVIGDLNWRMSTASQYGRRFGIDKLIIHSGYKNTAFGHDIGLIRTKEPMRPLKVNGRYIINSVCLPERGVEHQGEAELVGWGLFSNRNEMADSLQIAEVPILPRPLCVDLYRRRTGLIQWLIGIELITEKQVCAGTFGRGICQGDSGSALVYNEKQPSGLQPLHAGAGSAMRRHTDDSRATIIGIVAFGGIRRCSYQSLPGVYMQTSKYLDWILPRIQA